MVSASLTSWSSCLSAVINVLIDVISARADRCLCVLESVQFPHFKIAFLSCPQSLTTNVLPFVEYAKFTQAQWKKNSMVLREEIARSTFQGRTEILICV